MNNKLLLGLFLAMYSTLTLYAQTSDGQGKISGKIAASTGEALSGVSIVAAGTNKGTATDEQGNYELILADGNYTLSISLIGRESIAQQVIVRGEDQVINFTLQESITPLNELVILGSRSATARTNIDKSVPVDIIQLPEIKTAFSKFRFCQYNIAWL